jgi:DNA-binding response OmpR family regulator
VIAVTDRIGGAARDSFLGRCAVATVLWIEDETRGFANRKLLLQKCGHHLLTASNVRRVMDLFVQNPIDLVILDCHMWCMSSESIVTLLRTLRPTLPIILLSAFCPTACRRAAEANGCMQKSESAITLLAMIKTLTEGRTAKEPPHMTDVLCFLTIRDIGHAQV